MKRKSVVRQLIGREFNLWDAFVLGILGYYVYGVYTGVDTPLWRVFDLFAGGIFVAYIVYFIVGGLRKKTRK